MKDTELIHELSRSMGWDNQQTEGVLVALGEVMGEKLSANVVIQLQGLGQFEARKKGERVSVNPVNGKKYLVPPKLVAVFKPSTPLKNQIKLLENNG